MKRLFLIISLFIPFFAFAQIENGVNNDSLSSKSKLDEHKVLLSFYCKNYFAWCVSGASKDDVNKFVKEYSGKENVDLETASKILDCNRYNALVKFGYNDFIDFFDQSTSVSVSVDDSEPQEISGLVNKALEENKISIVTSPFEVEKTDFFYIGEENGWGCLYDCNFTIKGDFDLSKLSVVKEIIDVDGKSYACSYIYYDGEPLVFQPEESHVYTDSVRLILQN